MSKKTELKADLDRIGYELGGSHLTRQARSSTFNTFAGTMRERGYGIHAASQIGGRHLHAYAQQRTAQGISTLARWQRELQERGYVRVFEGTKGGRPREVHPPDLDRALTAMQRAQAILKVTGQPYLVLRSDRTVPAGLKQAQGIYRNLCSRAGIQSHGARYAFAQERIQAYRSQGLSEHEARAATSLDLGHGDGRGRYIASVYARGI